MILKKDVTVQVCCPRGCHGTARLNQGGGEVDYAHQRILTPPDFQGYPTGRQFLSNYYLGKDLFIKIRTKTVVKLLLFWFDFL